MIINPYRYGGGGGGSTFWGLTSYTLDGTGGTSNYRWGWVFVPTSDLDCNALRVQVTSSGTTERVIIHRNSDNAVIATADIAISGSDTWMEQTVTPFTLFSGVAYTISTRNTAAGTRGLRRGNTLAVNSLVTDSNPSGSVVITGGSDARPTSTSTPWYRSMDFGYK